MIGLRHCVPGLSPGIFQTRIKSRLKIVQYDAVALVACLGLVSLFADVAYEGARGTVGPFLAASGATGAAVATVSGAGELAGCLVRLWSGFAANRLGRYWVFTFVGFAVNLGAVPVLALATGWREAAMLIVAERVGKAVRNPSKEAILAYAAETTGFGWTFGLHQALDQAGAVLGPVIVSGILAAKGSYRLAFAMLGIPAAISLILLLIARFLCPDPARLPSRPTPVHLRIDRSACLLALTGLGAIGSATLDFALIGYHLAHTALVRDDMVPMLYSAAMMSQGISGYLCGRLFDRHGPVVLIVALAASSLAPVLAFAPSVLALVVGSALWGLGMGARESIVPAFIATAVVRDRRAGAYGLVATCFGVGWFLGSAVVGFIYDQSPWAAVAFSVIVYVSGLIILCAAYLRVCRQRRAQN